MSILDRLEQLETGLRTVLTDTPSIAMDVAARMADYMAELNRQQLLKGLRADGSRITPDYTPLTKKIKAKKGQPTNKVTLFDTGSYHSKIKFKRFSNLLEAQSDDPKDEHLQGKYGEGVLGLPEEHFEKVRDRLRPELLHEIKRLLP